MPNDLIIPVAKTVAVVEETGFTLKELSILAATPKTPGVLGVTLAAKDAEGNWREDVALIRVRKQDDPESQDPRLAQAASIFHALMFKSIVPDEPEFRAMGVVGLPVWDAAKVLLGQELTQ